MYHPDDFLERIRQTEINKLNTLSFTKLFSNLSIETTKEYGGTKKVKEDLEEKRFKHTSISKYLLLLFAISISFKTIKDTFFNINTNMAFLGLEFVLSAVFIYATIREFFFYKGSNYNILIDKAKIEIGKQTFLWKDIYETAILTKGGGKTKRQYFVIALKDNNTYEIFELNNFNTYWDFCATLSKYIEHFKPLNYNNTLTARGL